MHSSSPHHVRAQEPSFRQTLLVVCKRLHKFPSAGACVLLPPHSLKHILPGGKVPAAQGLIPIDWNALCVCSIKAGFSPRLSLGIVGRRSVPHLGVTAYGLAYRTPLCCVINEGLGVLFRRADRTRSWEFWAPDLIGSKEREASVARTACRQDL